MPRRRTKDEFMSIVNSNYDNITIISEFKNNNSDMIVMDELGFTFKLKARRLVEGRILGMRNAIDKTKFFIYKANLVYNNKYDYSISKYIGDDSKVEIICPEHGVFKTKANSHLYMNIGCPVCNNRLKSKSDAYRISFFKEKAAIVHDNKYTYNNITYKNLTDKILITCPIHGNFKQTAIAHLNGQGCPRCASCGYSRHEWVQFCKSRNRDKCILYVIKCYDEIEEFIKIGITSTSIKERYSSNFRLPYAYEIIKTIKKSPIDVFNLELKLKNKLTKFGYTPIKTFCGYTECYNLNVLENI